VDCGIYYFMTKPHFYLLHWLGDVAGNFGLGIIFIPDSAPITNF
jgi:hypothetical protein